MALEGVPTKTAELLEKAGITTLAGILAAGREGLEAINGIGPATAEHLLEWAAGQVEETGKPKEEEKPEEDVPAPPPPRRVEVRLAGRDAAIVAGFDMWRGWVKEVSYHHYQLACETYGKAAFEVRRPGETKWLAEL